MKTITALSIITISYCCLSVAHAETDIHKWYNSDRSVTYGNVDVPKDAVKIETDTTDNIYKWYNSDGTITFGNVNVPKNAEIIAIDKKVITKKKALPTKTIPQRRYDPIVDINKQLDGPSVLKELEMLDKLRAKCIKDRRTDCDDNDTLITQGAKRDMRTIEIRTK